MKKSSKSKEPQVIQHDVMIQRLPIEYVDHTVKQYIQIATVQGFNNIETLEGIERIVVQLGWTMQQYHLGAVGSPTPFKSEKNTLSLN